MFDGAHFRIGVIAQRDKVPICQDMRLAVAFLELGQDVRLADGDLNELSLSVLCNSSGNTCNSLGSTCSHMVI